MKPIHGVYFDSEDKECPVQECYVLSFKEDPLYNEMGAVALLDTGDIIYSRLCNFQINDPSFHFPDKRSKNKSSETPTQLQN